MTKPNVKLGDKVRDTITGFEGVVTAHAKHITGCDTMGVVPRKLDKELPIETQWFDIMRLEVVAPRYTEETPPGEGVG